jgi:hypothetical protein
VSLSDEDTVTGVVADMDGFDRDLERDHEPRVGEARTEPVGVPRECDDEPDAGNVGEKL